MTDIRTLGQNCGISSKAPINSNPGTKIFLEDDIWDTFKSMHNDCMLSREATQHRRCNIAGLQYADRRTSARNSIVYFNPSGSNKAVPGTIRQIFTSKSLDHSTSDETFLAIHQYLPLPQGYDDPFEEFSAFGVELWSKTLSERVVIVPATTKIYPTIRRPWDHTSFVLKALNRVSPFRHNKISLLDLTAK